MQGLQNKHYVWDWKAKEYSNSEGKKESRAYDELLQITWPKEVKPLLYFFIEFRPVARYGLPPPPPSGGFCRP